MRRAEVPPASNLASRLSEPTPVISQHISGSQFAERLPDIEIGAVDEEHNPNSRGNGSRGL